MRCRLKSPSSQIFPNRLLKCKSKKTPKFHISGLCDGNSPVTSEFPTQRASNTDNVFTLWRHHDLKLFLWNRLEMNSTGSCYWYTKSFSELVEVRHQTFTQISFTMFQCAICRYQGQWIDQNYDICRYNLYCHGRTVYQWVSTLTGSYGVTVNKSLLRESADLLPWEVIFQKFVLHEIMHRAGTQLDHFSCFANWVFETLQSLSSDNEWLYILAIIKNVSTMHL